MTDWTHVDAIFRRSSAQEPDCWRTWPIKIQVNWARLNAHQEPNARFAPKLIQNIDMSVAYSTKNNFKSFQNTIFCTKYELT